MTMVPAFLGPESISMGQPQREEAASRIRPMDHGASMALKRLRGTVGGRASITRYDGEAPALRAEARRHEPRGSESRPL